MGSGSPKPSVVLVRRAWSDSASWSGVITGLQAEWYPVTAPANPPRSLAGDSADYLKTIQGPVILVGQSYGGSVITDAATGNTKSRGSSQDACETHIETIL